MKFVLFMVIGLLTVLLVKAQNGIKKEDWPNLKKYEADNKAVLASGKKVNAVFMGNSITQNWYEMHPDFFDKNGYVGRGISGQTTPQMLIRFTPDVIDLHPKVVVILAGTNDIAGNTGFATEKMITDNIKAMATLAKANNIQVILCSILPVYQYPWRKDVEPVEKINNINTWMKNFAASNGFTYLDYFSYTADEKKGMKTDLSPDGVHPNEKGYAVMEPLVTEAINTLLRTN